jgi:hypothetical protein
MTRCLSSRLDWESETCRSYCRLHTWPYFLLMRSRGVQLKVMCIWRKLGGIEIACGRPRTDETLRLKSPGHATTGYLGSFLQGSTTGLFRPFHVRTSGLRDWGKACRRLLISLGRGFASLFIVTKRSVKFGDIWRSNQQILKGFSPCPSTQFSFISTSLEFFSESRKTHGIISCASSRFRSLYCTLESSVDNHSSGSLGGLSRGPVDGWTIFGSPSTSLRFYSMSICRLRKHRTAVQDCCSEIFQIREPKHRLTIWHPT